MPRRATLLIVGTLSAAVMACGATPQDDAGTNEAPLVGNISNMVRKPNGKFHVTCDNGVALDDVTASQIQKGEVCNGEYSRKRGATCDPKYSPANPNGINQCAKDLRCLWGANRFQCTDLADEHERCTVNSDCLNRVCRSNICDRWPSSGAGAPAGTAPSGGNYSCHWVCGTTAGGMSSGDDLVSATSLEEARAKARALRDYSCSTGFCRELQP